MNHRKSGFYAILKKELYRFFTDKRTVVTTIILPGLMIFIIYSFIGSAMQGFFSVSGDYAPTISAVNLPDSIEAIGQAAGLQTYAASEESIEQVKQQITNGEADLLVVFPKDFDRTIAARESASVGYAPPNVQIYYNSTSSESNTAYGVFSGMLNAYLSSLDTPSFVINQGSAAYDLVSEENATGFMLSSILPLLILIFLFTGGVGVGLESIAGEKERGTIATLLVTTLKRQELALGKVVSLSCIALLAALSSFVGVLLSIPSLLGASGSEIAGTAATLYGVSEYLPLLAVILSTCLLFASLISILSAFAKSVREASTLVLPLMILIMLVAVVGMFQGAQSGPLFFLIPAYNSVQSMVAIFSYSIVPLNLVITIISNLVLTGFCIFVLTRMFNSERIIFSH
ncbi:MAG: ABC transporter permease [Coriobacteriales bacterium]|jgi:sodium transport system permease protein|nr:ABC transporter permease [Coriobacteriales bacterium]